MLPPQSLLRSAFNAAVTAADPVRILPYYLPAPPAAGRTVVIGAGKAAAAMAKAVEDHWEGDPDQLTGLLVTRYGHRPAKRSGSGSELQATPGFTPLPRWHGPPRIEVVEAGHPVPDDAGQDAAARILELVQGLTENDLVLCLISGGGSSLLALPAPGISLADKQNLGRQLLRSGASIHEFNCVRKHLSAIKGGRLAQAAAPARVHTLVISDVPGDDLSVIASGPTVPDPTTRQDALAVLQKYSIAPSASVVRLLAGDAEPQWEETPKPGDPCFVNGETHIIATPQQALQAAARMLHRQGADAHILGNAIEGEAREIARMHAAIALQVATCGQPFSLDSHRACVLLSGGETSVTVRGKGRGGRNTEFLLALAIALNGHPGIYAIACDTDGIDGVEDNAGALIGPDTLKRAAELGLNPAAMLADNNAYTFFEALGDLVTTGPTLTNVNDFRAIWISPDLRQAPRPETR